MYFSVANASTCAGGLASAVYPPLFAVSTSNFTHGHACVQGKFNTLLVTFYQAFITNTPHYVTNLVNFYQKKVFSEIKLIAPVTLISFVNIFLKYLFNRSTNSDQCAIMWCFIHTPFKSHIKHNRQYHHYSHQLHHSITVLECDHCRQWLLYAMLRVLKLHCNIWYESRFIQI